MHYSNQFRRPHSVATSIGRVIMVIRDQKVPASIPVRNASVWTKTVMPNWFIKVLVVCKTMRLRVAIKDHWSLSQRYTVKWGVALFININHVFM